MRDHVSALLLAGSLTIGGGTQALAQERTSGFVHGGALGDLASSQSVNPGRVHVLGNLGLGNGDFFRGAFDDVPADRLAIGPDLAVAFELVEDGPGFAEQLVLTVGSQNNLADQVQPVDDTDLESWYESNTFLALTADLGGGLTTGLTYTVYASPNDVSGTAHELALAAKAEIDGLPIGLTPQVKLALPLESGDDGVFVQLQVAPSLTTIGTERYPITLSTPLTLGVGFDDYYGPGTGTTGYASFGLAASVPLAFMPADLGSWSLSGGVGFLLRDQAIADGGEPFDDEGSLVPRASVRVGFAY
ncbi:MAG: hypothetical protein R3349_10825 [Geminicoccaceae bacterium]|nr:hypothetical protein [Geminicoccaceae bacterium]